MTIMSGKQCLASFWRLLYQDLSVKSHCLLFHFIPCLNSIYTIYKKKYEFFCWLSHQCFVVKSCCVTIFGWLTHPSVVVIIPMFVGSVMFNPPFWLVKSPKFWLVQITIVTVVLSFESPLFCWFRSPILDWSHHYQHFFC